MFDQLDPQWAKTENPPVSVTIDWNDSMKVGTVRIGRGRLRVSLECGQAAYETLEEMGFHKVVKE